VGVLFFGKSGLGGRKSVANGQSTMGETHPPFAEEKTAGIAEAGLLQRVVGRAFPGENGVGSPVARRVGPGLREGEGEKTVAPSVGRGGEGGCLRARAKGRTSGQRV